MQALLERLRSLPGLGEGFVHLEKIPGTEAVFDQGDSGDSDDSGDSPLELSAFVKPMLDSIGAEQLYSHQTRAIRAVLRGRNVVVSTPTASGKSLVGRLPVFERLLGSDRGRALFLFPTKALARDQFAKTQAMIDSVSLAASRITMAVYDGDTPDHERKKIRENPPGILITNPDMLHAGLLPYHEKWSEFFRTLDFVVVDELHTYRGVFGSHVAQILRRLRRVAGSRGARPVFIGCSATIANPAELAGRLTGLEFEAFSESGAPQSDKYFLLYNPVESAHGESARLFMECLDAGKKAILFTRSRRATELIYSRILRGDARLASRVSSYRAGFLPEERREIEQGLFEDRISGVVSTSALEVGVDIGGLDVCILLGYPGAISTTRQRSGRVGRGDSPSLTIMVALSDALDQYFVEHPRELFTRPVEEAVTDPANAHVLTRHVVCAASEIPFEPEKEPFPREAAEAAVREAASDGRLLGDPDSNRWYSNRTRPHSEVDIRNAGMPFTIRDATRNVTIGTIGGRRAFAECHDGAIYLHHGRQYCVTSMARDGKTILVEPDESDCFTRVKAEKETTILECERRRPAGAFRLNFGRLRVTEKFLGYEKRRIFTQDLVSMHELDLPEQTYETRGLWIEIEANLAADVTTRGLHFMGGIHAIEHTTIGLFPLFVLCDRNDIGGICHTHHPQLKKAGIFIYDGYPGGVGLAAAAYDRVEALLDATHRRLIECPCEEGCPSCAHSPKCGSGNKPLDKAAAIHTLDLLLGRVAPRAPAVTDGRELEEEEPVEQESLFGAPRPKDIVVFDLETQKSAAEVGGWQNIHLMRMSVGVLYESISGKFRVYEESKVAELIERMKQADLVVGFNVVRFDYVVLSGYSAEDFNRIPTFDMLIDVRRLLGYRVSLDHLATRNLGASKSADGLQALEWFKQGKMEEIIEYCKQDVAVTRDLFEKGQQQGYVLLEKKGVGEVKLELDWETERIIEACRKKAERQG